MLTKEPIRHYINGRDLGEPRNWQDLEIDINWLESAEGVNINITDLEFVLEANRLLQERVLDGLSGGVGIFEGEPYDITVGDASNPSYRFNGYLDFTDDLTVIGKEEFSCSLKKRAGEDWLNDVADGFSFAFLREQGIITDADFVKVPYIINYVPDGTQLILLSISLFMMTRELITNVEQLAKNVINFADVAIPVIGVSVGLGAGAVTAWDLGKAILAAAKLAAQIAYTIAITKAIIDLIGAIFAQLLPPKRFHLGMRIDTLFRRSCDYLGLNYQSNLLSELSDWVHVPQKDRRGGEDGETGFPTNSGPVYTFGDAIRVFGQMFNADYRIVNNTFHFERRDNFQIPGTYVVPRFFQDQERLLDEVRFNTDEIVANYNINYQFDVQDQNTMDDQLGRVFQAVTTPNVIKDRQLVNIKGLTQIQIPFALGKTKTDLTRVEEVAKDLGKFVDKITGIFGGGTNFQSKITARLGSMLLSSDFISNGKIVKMAGSDLARNQRTQVGAQFLWDNYHFINSFAEVNGVHNQFWRYEGLRVPMPLEDFEKVLDNNIATNDQGEEIEIERVLYRPYEGTATIDFRIRRKYTNNLKITFL